MKTGDPNGPGLPQWNAADDMKNDPWIMEFFSLSHFLREAFLLPERMKSDITD